MVLALKEKVINKQLITKEEALALSNAAVEDVCLAANQLREHFCGNTVDLCSIANGKSGKCSENCKFCAQSSHYSASTQTYALRSNVEFVKEAVESKKSGLARYSIVTSGRGVSTEEVDQLCTAYQNITQNSTILLCASHGLLTPTQFYKLKVAGVMRYHCNLETSRRNFPSICTTHTYDDKINTIKAAQKAGLEVCSGGIMGLGETMEDRIDMALDLRMLGITSVPINILNPIAGTPFEHLPILSITELRRIVAVYRFILPKAALRLAGGRGLLADKGRSVFLSGANAAISGNMLTTSGISAQTDLAMLTEIGMTV